MNNQQQGRLSVLKAVAFLFNEMEDVWGDITPIALSFEELDSIIATIANTVQYEEQRLTTGQAFKETPERFNVINQAYTLSLKLAAFAKAGGHKQVLKDVDISFSDLKACSEALLLQRCSLILSSARKCKAKGFVAADETLNDLDLAIELYKLICINYNPEAEEYGRFIIHLENLLLQAERMLCSLDKLVESLITHKEFLVKYKQVMKPFASRKRQLDQVV